MFPRIEKQLASFVAFAFLCAPVYAQDGAVFHSDTRLVVLHVTVTDSNGNLVTDLPKSAFRVFEDSAQQPIKVFRREDVPVSMGLVLDSSSSMLPKRPRVAAGAMALVKASHPEDEVFIVNFNEETFLATNFTHDPKKLEEGLTEFDPRGSTAMRDALRLAIEHVVRQGKEDKKVLLVVTDGEDNASRINLEALVRAAQQSGVMIYTVGVMDDTPREEARRARRDLDALAKATGGQAYYLDNLDQVDGTAKQIAKDIRNQYTIAYTPTNEALDGTYRKLSVIVTDPQRPVLGVRTRDGYYAGGTANAKNEGVPADAKQPE